MCHNSHRENDQFDRFYSIRCEHKKEQLYQSCENNIKKLKTHPEHISYTSYHKSGSSTIGARKAEC